VPQIGVSLALLLVTGAVARTIITSEFADPGYRPEGLVAVMFSSPEPNTCNVVGSPGPIYDAARRRATALKTAVLDSLPRIPSIARSALSGAYPYDMLNGGSVVSPESLPSGRHFGVRVHGASPGFFETLGIRILSGRDFSLSEANVAWPSRGWPIGGAPCSGRSRAQAMGRGDRRG
jgi:hypothetical protein